MSKGKLKCSIEQLADTYQHWRNGRYGVIDFGQAVCVKFIRKGESFPALMNETNEFKAYSLARKECKPMEMVQ